MDDCARMAATQLFALLLDLDPRPQTRWKPYLFLSRLLSVLVTLLAYTTYSHQFQHGKHIQ